MRNFYHLIIIFFFLFLTANVCGWPGSETGTGSPQTLGCSGNISSIQNVLCNGDCNGSLTAISTGVPPFSYSWSTGDTGATANNLCAGTYSVTITDSAGCVATASGTVFEPTVLAATAVPIYANCTCTYFGTGFGGIFPYTYLWCDNSTSTQMINCDTGACSLIVTDANGCSAQYNFFMIPPVPLTVSSSSANPSCAACTDGSITTNSTGGNGPYTYTLLPDGIIQNNGVFNNLDTGTYTVCVTDANFCTVCDSNVVLSATGCFTTVIDGGGVIACTGDCTGSLLAIANGVPPFSYNWSPTGGTGALEDSLCAGAYTVTMTDSVGCVYVATGIVTEPPPLSDAITEEYVNCNCIFTVSAVGGTPGYTYAWCDGSVMDQLINCNPGMCMVYIVDANGCMVQDTVFINPPPALVVSAQPTGTTCIGCMDGIISGTASGGTPPYIYSLQPTGQINTTGIFDSLAAGVYTYCVTDTSGCTVCITDTVLEDPSGFHSPAGNIQFSISPNPFTETTRVVISEEMVSMNAQIVILDLPGREIFSVGLTEKETLIAGNNLPSGIYFFRIESGSITLATGKLVVGHH